MRKWAAFALALSWPGGRCLGQALDQYGGNPAIVGTKTGYFHYQKIGNRWFMIDPLGNAEFHAAVDLVTTGTGGSDYGGFLPYDAAYLYDALSEQFSSNLKDQAASSSTGDVISPASGVTVSKTGDALYFGSRLKPNYTYFWLQQLGLGGKIQWYYSTGNGNWRLINGTGNPSSGSAALNAGGSYNLDAGNYFAPDPNTGFGATSLNADRIVWWNVQQNGFPADFLPMDLPNDSEILYYVKGVVTQAFTTPPVLNQMYERAQSDEALAKKYGPDPTWTKWGNDITKRLRSWGFNTAGQYSFRYQNIFGQISSPLAMNPIWQIYNWSGASAVSKNAAYQAVCPPGSSTLLWAGKQPDVFDPNYQAKAMPYVLSSLNALNSNGQASWITHIYPEEGDWVYGLDSVRHPHFGYTILAANPYMPAGLTAKDAPTTFADPRLFAKYALRDYLRFRYKAPNDAIAPFTATSSSPFYGYSTVPSGYELTALQALNNAWGTHYTTWDTSSGSISSGSNAYGTGTGFMDENGQHVFQPLMKGSCNNISYAAMDSIAAASNPTGHLIRVDLDGYVATFSAHYGNILRQAFNQAPHPPVAAPFYAGPDYALSAVAPYVDLFSVVADSTSAMKIYNATHKPLNLEDYSTASPDSQLYFNAVIASIAYDPSTNQTILYAPGIHYAFRVGWFVSFPDVALSAFQGGACGYRTPYPPLYEAGDYAHWDTLSIGFPSGSAKNDYTGCVKAGMHVALSSYNGPLSGPIATQAQRAEAVVGQIKSELNLRGDDGAYFDIGFEHWALKDDAVSSWSEILEAGILTLQDNAYDGAEAQVSTGTSAAGYAVGGELANYGSFLGPLSQYLNGIYGQIQYDLNAIVSPTAPNGLAVQSTNSSSVNLTWNANTESNIAGYDVYYATSDLLDFTPAQALAAGASKFNSASLNPAAAIDNLTAGQWYFFRITAYNIASLESSFSNEVAAQVQTGSAGPPPAKPKGLRLR